MRLLPEPLLLHLDALTRSGESPLHDLQEFPGSPGSVGFRSASTYQLEQQALLTSYSRFSLRHLNVCSLKRAFEHFSAPGCYGKVKLGRQDYRSADSLFRPPSGPEHCAFTQPSRAFPERLHACVRRLRARALLSEAITLPNSRPPSPRWTPTPHSLPLLQIGCRPRDGGLRGRVPAFGATHLHFEFGRCVLGTLYDLPGPRLDWKRRIRPNAEAQFKSSAPAKLQLGPDALRFLEPSWWIVGVITHFPTSLGEPRSVQPNKSRPARHRAGSKLLGSASAHRVPRHCADEFDIRSPKGDEAAVVVSCRGATPRGQACGAYLQARHGQPLASL